MAERVYLLVPVHNRREITVRFAEAVRGQTHADVVLVLIDDGSGDGTADAVRAILPETIVLRGDGTWWWAGCMDRGYQWLAERNAPGEAVVGLMNDDVGIGPEFVANAVRELQSNPGTLLLARQIEAATGHELVSGVHVDVRHLRFTETADPAQINCLPTRGLFLRWGDLKHAGGFRPNRIRHYLADYEFTFRARQRGLMLRVAQTFEVVTDARSGGLTRAELTGELRRIAIVLSHRFKENPRDWLGFAWTVSPPARRPWLTLKIAANSVIMLGKAIVAPRSHDKESAR